MSNEVPIRPSSTVVLVRAADGVPQIFMVKRHAESSFGSAFAFPGGVLDPDDAKVHPYCQGLSTQTANTRLGVEEAGLDYYSAAIRELFEECGVLLADASCVDENLNVIRDGLNDGSRNWTEVVTTNHLNLQCSALHYIGHWVTPPSREKRYTTRFFVALLPEGQVANHCGLELTESRWTSATDMLAAWRGKQLKLHYPTVKTLESLARHKRLSELLDWAESCAQWGVTSMVPVIIQRDGKDTVVLPGDKDYPGTNL